ncbi:hypothetical protein BC940DRAFT_288859 [Gongronella butleri]|nr:hypothetical protein BC940DRAFT_288859 [Gongronella butleri]
MARKKMSSSTADAPVNTTTAASSGDGSSQAAASVPRILLRTYRPTDNEAVQYLFTTTMFALVPEGVRRKLWSPLTWIVWFVGYGALLMTVPRALVRFAGMDNESMWMTGVRMFVTFAWALFGFSVMFIVTERFEMVDKVEQALENDLKDPEAIYLKYEAPFDDEDEDEEVADDDEASRRKQQQEEKKKLNWQQQQEQEVHRPGHFWLLLADDEPCGMLGLAPAFDAPKMDQRTNLAPIWKQVLRALSGNRFQFGANSQPLAVIPSGPAHTATIVRWAVANQFQQCGLSSLLMHRAMTWAHDAGIRDVYAITNEVELAAEQILEKRHGFRLVRRHKIGLFGRYRAVWVCKVVEWMAVNGNHVNSRFKPKDDKKEE